MRILHIAPFNTAGVPLALVKAERELGHYSRLVTLARHPFGYPEDICLDLPFITTPGLEQARSITTKSKADINNFQVFEDPGPAKRLFFSIRDIIWTILLNSGRLNIEIDPESFDLYQLDGGLSILRSGEPVTSFADKGKPVISMYYGSDLRTRGVLQKIHDICCCNFTVEYDHLDLYPGIFHVPFPFDFTVIGQKANLSREPVRIGHAPSNRALKGTDIILEILEKLKKDFSFETVLIENLSHEEALILKNSCTLFIDQISDLGYGINSIESLAMGIPTFSSLTDHFKSRYPDHAIVEINRDNLLSELKKYLTDSELRKWKGAESIQWVYGFHDPVAIVKKIHGIAAGKHEYLDEIFRNTGTD